MSCTLQVDNSNYDSRDYGGFVFQLQSGASTAVICDTGYSGIPCVVYEIVETDMIYQGCLIACQTDGSISDLPICTANACASTEVANSNKSGTGSISGSTGAVVSVTCNARPKPKKTLSKKRRKKSNVG